jgi:hypothetical protein
MATDSLFGILASLGYGGIWASPLFFLALVVNYIMRRDVKYLRLYPQIRRNYKILFWILFVCGLIVILYFLITFDPYIYEE